MHTIMIELGVSEVIIYAWIKKFTPMEMEDTVTSDDYAELQKQMLRLKEKMKF
ncbi:MAG TPA: hypothetical protein VK094_09360 [Pseudogracilibacillus sp.]|nr:hypothetical protein [Pseudogracilibacillus sp.]